MQQAKHEASLFPDLPTTQTAANSIEVPGLVYRPDFITADEESRLVELLDAQEWNADLKRRVQHYGWKYDYNARRIDKSMRIGSLPNWAHKLSDRLVDERLMHDRPDQLIVNEYRGKQGISRHIDKTHSFTGEVATISLLETWGMVFRWRNRKKVEKRLARRSAAILMGAARYQWSHEIPARKYELTENHLGEPVRVERKRRISLTFRKTRKR